MGALKIDPITPDSTPETLEAPIMGKILQIGLRQEKLTPNQRKAAALLAEGLGCQEAADRVKVNLRTIQYWRNQTLFKAEYEKLSKEYIKKCTAKMSITDEAMDAVSRESLIAGLQRDPKLAFEYRKARGLISVKEDLEEVDKPITIQFGVLAKDSEEVEDMLRDELPIKPNLEPTFKPKIVNNDH